MPTNDPFVTYHDREEGQLNEQPSSRPGPNTSKGGFTIIEKGMKALHMGREWALKIRSDGLLSANVPVVETSERKLIEAGSS
jgi:hypothetical protein